jgi:hypothetical protein
MSVRSRAKTPAKQETRKYKSAEFAGSESSGSDADPSDHSQQPRKDSPQTLKRLESSKPITTSTTAADMRMDDLSWGASSSSRKRPLPPTSYPEASKRPKQGPFVVNFGSEDDSVSDDDDGYNFDKHIAGTPEWPARRVVANRPRDPEQEVKALPATLKTSTVRQNVARDFDSQSDASKTLAPHAGKLNKNRLLMMMAKNHGGPGSLQTSSVALKTATSSTIGKDAVRSNAFTRTPALVLSANKEVQNGLQSAAQASSVSQGTSKSFPTRNASTTLQAASVRRNVQVTPTGSSARPMQERRRLTQAPIPSNRNDTQTRTQQNPSPHSASATTRKADTARSENAAKSNSLRHLLDTQKTTHCKAAQEPDNIGSEWRRAQIGRASSVSLAKDTHRPGVGARYGHTLGARKGNSQDKDSRSQQGAPATTGDDISERAGSETHAMPSTLSQSLDPAGGFGGIRGRIQQRTPTSNFKNPVACDFTPTIKRTSKEDLQQPGLKAGLNSPSAYRIPPRLVLNKKTELVQSAFAQWRDEEPRNDIADGTTQQPINSSPISPRTALVQDRFTAQDVISSTVKDPVPEKKALSQSSRIHSKHKTLPSMTQQADESRYTPNNAPGPVSSEVHPSQQVAAESIPVAVHSKLNSNTGDHIGLNNQFPLKNASAATSAQPKSHVAEDVDEEVTRAAEMINSPTVDHVVRSPDLYGSSVASIGPRMPVAIMVRPGSSIGRSFRAQGIGEGSPSPDSVVGTETSQTADESGSSECQTHPPDKTLFNTDTVQKIGASLTDNGTQALVVSQALESIDVSPDGQGPVSQDQSVASQVDPAAEDDAISEHPQGRSSDIVEPAESVDDSQNESAAALPATPGISPFAPETVSSPGSSLLSGDSGWAPSEARTTIVPQPIPSKTLMSQPFAVFLDANDAEQPTIRHAMTTATVQRPTSSSTAGIALPSPTIPPNAEPYFEYSIHQSIILSPSSTTTTELSAQPFTALDSANAQTDKLFHNFKQQYELLGMRCRTTTSRVLDKGLSVHKVAFTNIEDPSRSLTLKLWVERAEVSVYANHTPSLTSTEHLISKTLYALRLWRLTEQTDSGSESEADGDNEDEERGKQEKEQFRIYHALPHICTELHTSLESANRAAKRVQIELSHEKAPKSMQAHLQRQNLRELNEKLEDLRLEMEDGENESGKPSRFEYEEGRRRGCWRSKFKGVGYNGYDFELLVTSVGVSGPRNV